MINKMTNIIANNLRAMLDNKQSLWIEFSGATGTFLTLSYIFLLNPIFLSQAGMELSSAFVATVFTAAISTLIMGLFANAPFALAPAPSITTFFVSFVVVQSGLSWQSALGAVFLSGLFCFIATYLSIRKEFIKKAPVQLEYGVLFALAGFLSVNGLRQAKVVTFNDGIINFQYFQFSFDDKIFNGIIVTSIGFLIAYSFRYIFKLTAGPLISIIFTSIIAIILGMKASTDAKLSDPLFDTFFKIDFTWTLSLETTLQFFLAALMFFAIDFYGGLGKYIGLLSAMGDRRRDVDNDTIQRAMYTDSAGNMLGSIFGAASLGIFVSSAVGIKMGARTGLTAIFISIYMFACILFIPLVGTIPREAIGGVLIFIGFLLVPRANAIKNSLKDLSHIERLLDLFVFAITFLIAFITFGIDISICMIFIYVTFKIIYKSIRMRKIEIIKNNVVIVISTFLLSIAVIGIYFLK